MILKIFALLVAVGLIFSQTELAYADKVPNQKSVNITYLVKSGFEKYYVQFKACIGNSMVVEPSFTVSSDRESKQIKFVKTMMPNTCKTFETSAKANHGDSVQIKW